jgi:adsorption protein B
MPVRDTATGHLRQRIMGFQPLTLDADAQYFLTGHLLLGEAVLALALLLALSGLDDLVVDLVFLARALWQRRVSRVLRPTAEAMHLAPVAPMAIIIPAWDEAAVIGAMLTRLLTGLDYPDYRVFVGLYPNDPAGRAAVAAIDDDRLQVVLCHQPGPTTKSDCLNHLWHAVEAFETTHAMRFKAIVLHDAEDVLHSQELRVQNALIPQFAMVQLPVIPLIDAQSRWVSGHYIDEFSTNHIKDIMVREALGAAVPSAGVACAIDRNILGRLAVTAVGPFDPICMTEDYELGLRIKALGGRTALVRVHSSSEPGIVATRGHFPATFDAARRQKTRWLLGIALSGWDRLGWRGGLADRYMLLRDRKAVATALLAMLAYGMTLLVIAERVSGLRPAGQPPLLDHWGHMVLALNVALVLWRLAMRSVCTAHSHGWPEGLRAVPRTLVSNVINAAAAWSALQLYIACLRAGTAPDWDKTAHRFPDDAGL